MFLKVYKITLESQTINLFYRTSFQLFFKFFNINKVVSFSLTIPLNRIFGYIFLLKLYNLICRDIPHSPHTISYTKRKIFHEIIRVF